MKLRPIGQDKRGTIVDVLTAIVAIFAFAVVTLVAFTLYNKWNAAVNDNNMSQASKDIMTQTSGEKTILDNFILFALFGLAFMAMISAYFIDTHPVFFWISIIILVIIIVLATVLSNTYSTIEASETLNSTAAEFPKTSYVVNHLPLFVVGMGIIVLIIMYAKYTNIR